MKTRALRLLAVCNYPSQARPAHQVFVRAIVKQWATLGVDVTVLAPQSVWNLAKRGRGLAPRHDQRDDICIRRPRYATFSTVPLPFGGNTFRWTVKAHARASIATTRRLRKSFDVCYAHFLYPHGSTAARLSRMLGIPAVLGVGESSFRRYQRAFTRAEISRELQAFSHVITNSFSLHRRCLVEHAVPEEKLHMLPNGVDQEHFFPRDRHQARERLKLPQDQFIVISVGQFIERKGPLRILEAIRSRPEIGAVFLGYGPQKPQGRQVLYRGAVPHEEVPWWLSAADVFVLPTLAEGCCNAVLEALSCGLPVVSSDLPFNHGVLDENVSLLVDPLDRIALERALVSLLENPARCRAMRAAAVARARSFRLGQRASQILGLLRGCADPLPEAGTRPSYRALVRSLLPAGQKLAEGRMRG